MESKQMHHFFKSIFTNKQKLDFPCKGEDVKREQELCWGFPGGASGKESARQSRNE